MLRRNRKGIAALLLLTFVQQIFAPTVTFALTGGPSQPEVESFEPVGTNQMVDLTTGDFNYNIPLMVVPGPNGGYPINLAYHAGVTMEQEASWVGLGWNINAGAITRNLRGVPDDFKGDKITQTNSSKTDITVGLGYSNNPGETKEFLGFEVPFPSYQLYYNNYRGVGYSISTVFAKSFEFARMGRKSGKSLVGNLNFNLSFDSQAGLGMSPSLSLASKHEKDSRNYRETGFTVGVGLHSRQGMQNVYFNANTSKGRNITDRANRGNSVYKKTMIFGGGAGINFCKSTYVPSLNTSTTGWHMNLSLTLEDKDIFLETQKSKTISGFYSQSKIKDQVKSIESYGSWYLNEFDQPYNHEDQRELIIDYNVQNDIPVSENSVLMPVPNMTNDIYSVSGQGVGGVFRSYNNSLGRFFPTMNKSKLVNVNAGLELALGTIVSIPGTSTAHIGVDAGVGFHEGYSGPWTADAASNLSDIEFEGLDPDNPLYEPVYYKMTGEHMAVPLNEWSHLNGEEIVAFDVDMKWTGLAPKPVVNSNLINSSKKIEGRSKTKERRKKLSNIQYNTRGEITKDEGFYNRASHIFNFNEIPSSTITGSQIDYSIDYSGEENDIEHHQNEYSVLKDDGSEYVYGLPVYNKVQKEVVFSNTNQSYDKYTDYSRVEYDPLDASVENEQGNDEYYSSTEIPAYAHSFLLTEVKSTDYVDLTGNGISDDDFGFFAKFNYSKIDDYKWRAPFSDATYIKGFYSNSADDKASFIYGEKELYYLNSIETKSHIAVFVTGKRNDGRGVSGEHQTLTSSLGAKQRYLKRIELYSKSDIEINGSNAVPVQTVHFEYNYELCPGIENNDDGIDDQDYITSNEGGKLTLKKVYITYNGNEKGRFSPYQFNYGYNKAYDELHMDRWGYYQEPESGIPNEHAINPYTKQDLNEIERSSNAGTWALSTITLPSGGDINVYYEQDDYGYVQDKEAMQMVEIYGFSDPNASTNAEVLPTGDDRFKMKRKNTRIWFKLRETLGNHPTLNETEEVFEYVEGIEELYFKTYQKIKYNPDPNGGVDYAQDYVVGYAQTTDVPGYGYDPNNLDYAYVDVKEVSYKTALGDLFNTHPFRKAGWQYLRFKRPDLFNYEIDANEGVQNVTGQILALLNSVGVAVSDAISFLTMGYYNKARLLGYNKKLDNSKPSFLRLNCPNNLKYGGGHRVKAITMSDNWVESDGGTGRIYGTEYEYVNEDGTTSGVADYEPIVGGEENALKLPHWYNGNENGIVFQDYDVYTEEPIAEGLYPGPRVVYGRVVQRGLNSTEFGGDPQINKGQVGVTVSEFYTAKDFPVRETFSELETTDGFNMKFTIPFIGNHSFQNNGYSQGYKVELNDMSGRPKSVAEYPFSASNIDGEPISKVEYIYQTSPSGQLDNKVQVMDGHGETRPAYLGIEQELFIAEEENHNIGGFVGAEVNVNAMWGPAPTFIPIVIVPTVVPNLSYSEEYYRGISTNKVIYRSGILKEVRAYSDGSTVSTENLLFDAETGSPLLTRVNNSWDKPVYNYNYAAHWSYEGMGGAYQNYKAKFTIEDLGGGNFQITGNNSSVVDPSNILFEGDEIKVLDNGVYEHYFITSVDDVNYTFTIEDGDGNAAILTANTHFAGIERSHFRNLQSVSNGSIVGLSNPSRGISLPVFDYYNEFFSGKISEEVDENFLETPCGDYFKSMDFVFEDMGTYYRIRIDGIPGQVGSPTTAGVCSSYIEFPSTYSPSLTLTYPENGYHINSFDGISQLVLTDLVTGEEINCTWNDAAGPCWRSCGQILHADAITFAEDWGDKYPYSDVGEPQRASGLVSDAGINEYRYGKKGIWRPVKTYLYQADRAQSGHAPVAQTDYFETAINKDGNYELFTPFDWNNIANNTEWDWVSEITRYSPYGFAIEEQSRLSTNPTNGQSLELYNSQMYGYHNSLVTATSSNASYFEMAYDGFEENQLSVGLNYESFGHFNWTSAAPTLSTSKAHTGEVSALISDGNTLQTLVTEKPTSSSTEVLEGVPGKDYIFSMWVYTSDGGKGALSSTASVATVSTDDKGEQIDGWKKLELKITMPSSGNVTISYTSTGSTYIDDLRFGPFDGGMVTYVYDVRTLWLLAELDGLNYATFYNYDEEGNLVQVKKETENGIMTISTARSNTKRIGL